jgi:hypothetical protein
VYKNKEAIYLSPKLLNFALEYVAMELQGNRKGLEPNDPNQVSVNSDDSNLMSENIYIPGSIGKFLNCDCCK